MHVAGTGIKAYCVSSYFMVSSPGAECERVGRRASDGGGYRWPGTRRPRQRVRLDAGSRAAQLE